MAACTCLPQTCPYDAADYQLQEGKELIPYHCIPKGSDQFAKKGGPVAGHGCPTLHARRVKAAWRHYHANLKMYTDAAKAMQVAPLYDKSTIFNGLESYEILDK